MEWKQLWILFHLNLKNQNKIWDSVLGIIDLGQKAFKCARHRSIHNLIDKFLVSFSSFWKELLNVSIVPIKWHYWTNIEHFYQRQNINAHTNTHTHTLAIQKEINKYINGRQIGLKWWKWKMKMENETGKSLSVLYSINT